MNDLFKINAARITSCYSNTDLLKSEENDLEKSGPGSRGGKVIGTTKSGKPIYDTFSHEGHKDFTSQDHKDAENLHLGEKTKQEKKYFNKDKDYDSEKSSNHSENFNKHRTKSIELKEKEKSEKKERPIGKTQSGKDIYNNFDHPAHKDFNDHDHLDAAELHSKKEKEWDSKMPKDNREARASVANEKAEHSSQQKEKHSKEGYKIFKNKLEGIK